MKAAISLNMKCEDHIEYLLLPVLFALFMTLFLMATNTDNITKMNKKSPETSGTSQNCCKFWKDKQVMTMVNISIFKNILYYQQAVNQVLSSSSLSRLSIVFSSIFNLSITSSSHNANPWCFIHGLTAKQKVLIDLFVPFMILVFISIIYVLSKCILKKEIEYKGKRINFNKTAIATFLMIISKILSVLFKLLNCQSIGDEQVHMYFAYEQCYGISWIIALLSLLFIIFMVSLVYIKVYKMNDMDRNNPSGFAYTLVNKYKSQYFYWEYILFWRRVIISLFTVSIDDIAIKCLFVCLMVFFDYIQSSRNPFIIKQCNNLEHILLLFFIAIAAFEIAEAVKYFIINVMVSIS